METMAVELRLFHIFLLFFVFKFGINVQAVSNNPDDVGFYLFPNPSDTSKVNEIIYNDNASLVASLFNCSLEVKILVHGFGGNGLEKIQFPGNVVDAYSSMSGSFPCNVLSVDWEKLATKDCPGGSPYTACLLAASENVRVVGERIGLFIVWIHTYCGLGLDSFHVVGHSLGSHVSGLAGATVINKTGSQIERVTTLDPIGSSTYLHPFQIRPLSANDASYTDMHHTSILLLSEVPASADLTLYVNGGFTPQPGCTDIAQSQACSHAKSWEYYEMSIRNPQNVPATRVNCTPFLNPGCGQTITITYGEHCDTRTNGAYYVPYPPP